MPTDLIGTRDATAAAGVPYHTLMYWIRRGYLDAYKRGYHVLVSRADVERERQKRRTIVPKMLPGSQPMATGAR